MFPRRTLLAAALAAPAIGPALSPAIAPALVPSAARAQGVAAGQVPGLPATLNIFVPAAPGGGWDGLGRAVEQVARQGGLGSGFAFENLAGGAGTVGLARFVAQRRGRADSLFVGGASLVGPTIVNRSPVSLADVTPLARLTEEAAVVVVPPDSPYRSMRDLGEALRAEPRGIPIAGAGGGTVDHVILGLLLKAVGRRPLEAQLVSFPGGGATTAAVMGGQVKAAIAGWGEFEEHAKAGRVRALATSGARRLAPEVPTLRESGYDVVAANWRGLFAAPGITPEARAGLARFVAALHALPGWKALLETRGWDDAYLEGEAFEAFLRRDRADTEGVLKDLGLA